MDSACRRSLVPTGNALRKPVATRLAENRSCEMESCSSRAILFRSARCHRAGRVPLRLDRVLQPLGHCVERVLQLADLIRA